MWVYTGGFHKFELSILQVWTLILQVEFVISQLGGDSATWRWFATCFAAWRWFRNVVCSCEDGVSTCDLRSGTRVLGGGFAAAKHLAKFRSCEMGFGLRNFRIAWRSCLQTAITSSFQLQFVHHLKRWTPDFPSFKTTYSMHEMDSRKYSKYVQQLLSSWILHVRFLCFSSLHSWLALAKNYEAPKLGFFM